MGEITQTMLYKTRLGDFEYNYATVVFQSKPDATAACKALNGAALLGSEALMVRYATNTRADDMSDDDNDDGDDGDDSDMQQQQQQHARVRRNGGRRVRR